MKQPFQQKLYIGVILSILIGCGGGSSPSNIKSNTQSLFDTSFNQVGYTVHDKISNTSCSKQCTDMAFDITLDKNNKILVTGASFNNLNADMVVLRYNQDGSLDSTLRNSGMLAYNNAAGGNNLDIGYAVKVDSNNKIVVVGASSNGNNNDFVIWRFHENGLIDSSFGNNGIVVIDNLAAANSNDIAYDLAIDQNDNIYITGESKNTTNNDTQIVVVKLKNDGSFDTTFGNNGIKVLGSLNSDDKSYAIALDKNNKIVLAGESKINNNIDMIVIRLNSDGSIDTNFGNNGVFIHNSAAGGNGFDSAKDLVITSDNKILITGASSDSLHYNMVVWKLNEDGSLDNNFGNNGIGVYFNIASKKGDIGNAIVLDKNNKIYIAGMSLENRNDMVVWRLNSDGTLDKSFGENGFVTQNGTAGGNGSDGANAIAINSDNKALVTGFSNNGVDFDIVVWKLND